MKKAIIVFLIAVIAGVVYVGLKKQTNSPVEMMPTPTEAMMQADEPKIILQNLKDNQEIDCSLADSCKVDKIVGNYAKGTQTGAYWMALKTEGKWKTVLTGNGIPQCAEVDKFSIPVEIYGNCIDASGELRN
jgi:hypothetical protein